MFNRLQFDKGGADGLLLIIILIGINKTGYQPQLYPTIKKSRAMWRIINLFKAKIAEIRRCINRIICGYMAFYIQNRDNWTDFTWDGKKVLLKLSEIGHLQGKLLDWIENEIEVDPVLKAAMAHLWFVTIHPFEDGNGRKTRAITEMILARSDRQYATKKF